VRHLLAHASGLGPDDARHPLTPPGLRRIYSNAGYEVLAAHLEERSGLPFATYLGEAVLEPAGMAGAELSGSPASGLTGTLADLAALAGTLLAPGVVASGSLEAARTVAFPKLSGVLPGFGRHVPCPWGLGPEVRGGKQPHWTGASNSPATYGHFGQSGTFVWVDPALALACCVLTDRNFGPWAAEVWPALADAVVAAAPSHRPDGTPGAGDAPG
jgi:CubicO group peptidase (beta-lactamase class C family)